MADVFLDTDCMCVCGCSCDVESLLDLVIHTANLKTWTTLYSDVVKFAGFMKCGTLIKISCVK